MKNAFAIGAGVAAGVVVAGWLWRDEIAQGASDAVEAVNPVNNDNIFARGFNAVNRALFGWSEADTLGSKIYDWSH